MDPSGQHYGCGFVQYNEPLGAVRALRVLGSGFKEDGALGLPIPREEGEPTPLIVNVERQAWVFLKSLPDPGAEAHDHAARESLKMLLKQLQEKRTDSFLSSINDERRARHKDNRESDEEDEAEEDRREQRREQARVVAQQEVSFSLHLHCFAFPGFESMWSSRVC
jgi:hypothetical protein